MSVAGVAILFAIYSFAMSILNLCYIVIWRKKGTRCRGIIREIKSVEDVYRDMDQTEVGGKRYIYMMEIHCEGRTAENEYIKTVRYNRTCALKSGAEIGIIWDPESNTFFDYTKGKRALLLYLLACIVFAAVFVIVFKAVS